MGDHLIVMLEAEIDALRARAEKAEAEVDRLRGAMIREAAALLRLCVHDTMTVTLKARAVVEWYEEALRVRAIALRNAADAALRGAANAKGGDDA